MASRSAERRKPITCGPLHVLLKRFVAVQHEPLAAGEFRALHEPNVILLWIRPEYPRDLFHRTERWLPAIGVLRAHGDWKRDPVGP